MQIIRSNSTNTGFNLAAEEYLFSQRQDEILFLYVDSPSVVIGCNQALFLEANTDFCSANSIALCRRMSGGGAVYHDEGNLNYCFIKNRIPGKFPLGGDFLKPVVQVLTDFGLSIEVGKRKDLWLPEGFKISGTASHVGKDRELHHGTLLYDTDIDRLIKSLTAKPMANSPRAIASVSSPVKNIRQSLTEQNLPAPPSSDFFRLFTRKMLEYYQLDAVSSFSENDTLQIQRLKELTYDSNEWIFKK